MSESSERTRPTPFPRRILISQHLTDHTNDFVWEAGRALHFKKR
jgi:hypothetical protein